MAGPYAFVTLITSDAYLPGALAQVAALRDIHPHPPLYPQVPFHTVCLVTPETVDVATIKLLRRAFSLVIGVEILEQADNNNLKLLGRPDLTTVLTKLHVFRLVQYSKIVFLDADVLPIRPLSHLFNIEHEFAAVPDVGWPDIFNSGVLVLSPGEDKFNQLNNLLKSKGSWDGGDQGLLNEWRAGNWHRLSFTYNTTPTAAYTYAPAYERFGSQINAIHFIGPNKPWKSIPSRSPFFVEKRVVPDTNSAQQQAYDYDSLVDRWFAVYDKHYRSQPIISPSFEVKRYPSVWDAFDSPRSPRSDSHRSGGLDLEDLRKIAIEGMNATGLVATPFQDTHQGEGEYQSMPLEGRFDLMRPRTRTEQTDKEDDATIKLDPSPVPEPRLDKFLLDTDAEMPMTPIVRHLDPLDEAPRWQTLPTPGPDEIPPSPKPQLAPLPSTPTPIPDYYASSAGQTSDSEGWYGPEGPERQTNGVPHLFSQVSQTRQARSGSKSSAKAPGPSPHVSTGESSDRNTSGRHSPTSDHQSGHSSRTYGNTHRGPSPPLLVWDPAIEPPPKDTPVFSGFPSDTYFTNAWDETHTRKHSLPQKNSPEHPSGLFEAPPPPQIPETLRMEGHYRNVIGDGALGATPSPDRNKVKPVFPWEGQPRQLPSRVFPDSDAPSPTHFIGSASSRTSPVTPRTPANKSEQHSHTLTPLHGLPISFNYSNAWDAVPSIQNYASRLAQPSQSPPTLAPAFGDSHRQNKDREKSWDDRLEASSRDGDDEDEGDNDDDNDVREPDSDDDDRSFRPRASRAPSVIEDTRQAQQSAQKSYRTQGVQTIPREKRNQSVQVSVAVEPPKGQDQSRPPSPGKRSITTTNRSGRGAEFLVRPSTTSTPESNKSRSIPPSPPVSPSRPNREFIAPPLSNAQRPPIKMVPTRVPDSVKIPTPPRTGITHKPITPPKPSSAAKISTPPARPSIQTNRHGYQGKGPSVVSRQISNDSSIGSPASSVGPVSPPDDQPMNAAARKGTRVWDPARGVELFKRGSEDVLARFLKMGSWDETGR